MDLRTFQRRNKSLTKDFVKIVLGVFDTVALGGMNDSQWSQILDLIYPEVKKYREQGARLAREFYDAERKRHGLGDWPINLPVYKREWFHEDMARYKQGMSRKGSDAKDVTKATMGAVKVVEDGGRRTVLRAIKEETEALKNREVVIHEDSDAPVQIKGLDPRESNFIKNPPKRGRLRGWARVTSGDEPCSWCVMLASRGPVFEYSAQAGAKESLNRLVIDDYDAGVNIQMKQWHPNCNCTIVPVFSNEEWSGKEDQQRLYEMWKKVTKGHEDKLNAWRREFERGDLDFSFLPNAK